jgi:hypothetical protein
VREDVAELVGRTGFGSQQRGALVLDGLDAIAPVAQQRIRPAGGIGADARCIVLTPMMERAQAALAHVILPRAHIDDHLRPVARDTERRRDNEKAQDQQEPPGAVHLLQGQRVEQVRPERAELVDVVRYGSFCLSTVPMMLAMAITVSSVMAKRIEDSSSTPSRSTR